MTDAGLQTPKTSRARSQQLVRVHALVKSPIVIEFQSDALEIEERPPPRYARMTLYAIAALIIAAVAWACVATVDKVVAAPGKLLSTASNLVVQPLETSIVRQIHVSIGQQVKRGQPLATLDSTIPQADVSELRARFSAFKAATDRLEAELAGREFKISDPASGDESIQEKLFIQRKAFYDASLRNLDAQISSAEANIATSHGEAGILAQRLNTLSSVEGMRSSLMDKELGSRLNFLLSRDARLEVENDLGRTRGNEVDLTHRSEKARAERDSFIEDFRRATMQELVDTIAKRNDADQDLKKAELRQQMVVLSAPVDAVVLEVAPRSVGSVVREAETLFVLVPLDAPLEAEVNVESKDIAEVAIGQAARIKFDAFPFQKYGTGAGRVRVISADTFSPEQKGEGVGRAAPPYYRVRVELTDRRLRGAPDQVQLMPGMTVTAELKTGKRSVISYFLYPLLRGLDESIREP